MTEPKKIENHCRNYLPHIENQKCQMITFRLYDSVPKDVIQQWKDTLDGLQVSTKNGLQASSLQENGLRASTSSLQHNGLRASNMQESTSSLQGNKQKTNTFSNNQYEARRILKLLDKYEDAGYGQCYLRDDRAAQIVKDALFYYDQEKYEVVSWCIMPNHVHVLITLLKAVSLSEILHSWRSFSSNEINKLFDRQGRLWMPEYFDRYIRDEEHFNNVVNYIHNNPVKAGLVDDPTHYRWSSAFVGSQASSLQDGLRASSMQEDGLQVSSMQEDGLRASSLQDALQASSMQDNSEYSADWKSANLM